MYYFLSLSHFLFLTLFLYIVCSTPFTTYSHISVNSNSFPTTKISVHSLLSPSLFFCPTSCLVTTPPPFPAVYTSSLALHYHDRFSVHACNTPVPCINSPSHRSTCNSFLSYPLSFFLQIPLLQFPHPNLIIPSQVPNDCGGNN